MDIKIVPNGHKNSLNEQKIVQMDIKIVQMELFCVMRLSNKFCHELIYGNLKKKI